MKFLRLHADAAIQRIEESGEQPAPRSLGNSLLVGGIGFTAISLLVFGIWAFAGRALSKNFGEGGFYAVCAIAFIGLSGALFNRLIVGNGTLARFYALFTFSFIAYSICWCAAWFLLRQKADVWYGFATGARPAGVVGALIGTAAMSACFSAGFLNWKPFLKNATILFFANTVGYFLGDLAFTWLLSDAGATALDGTIGKATRVIAAKLSWGLGYGLGFGLGIAHNLHTLQEPLRFRLEDAVGTRNSES